MKFKYTDIFIEMSKDMRVQRYDDRKTFYYVKSCRNDDIYEVMQIKNKWYCNCPSKCYHINKYCKHIMAVLFNYYKSEFDKEIEMINEKDDDF